MADAKRQIAITFVVIVTLLSAGYAQKRQCTDNESRQALDEASTLRSWDSLHRSYRLYRQCDDGAIGEGYSESIARILVDHWNTLLRLPHFARADAEFRAFVMKHVDATLNMKDVDQIKKKAKTQCPAGLRTVCDDLAKQADSAEKDASPPLHK